MHFNLILSHNMKFFNIYFIIDTNKIQDFFDFNKTFYIIYQTKNLKNKRLDFKTITHFKI